MLTIDLPRRRRRRVLVTVAAGVVLGLVVATAGYRWLTRPDHEARVQTLARGVADDLEDGRVPDALRVEDGTSARSELRSILAGMGTIRPDVTVASVQIADGGTKGEITFDLSWTVHEGKDPWTYQARLPVTRSGATWTGTWTPAVLAPDLDDGEVLRAVRISAGRGDILGDGGSTLVTRRHVARVGVDRGAVTSDGARASAARVARVLDIDEAPFAQAVSQAGDEAFVEGIVLRSGDPQLPQLRRALDDIDGARIVDDTMHLAPTPTFAVETLGRVGPATSEIIEASDGEVREGDVVGAGGLQAKHDDTLRGTSGYEIHAVSPDTAAARSLHRVDAVDGTDLRTTLSEPHQVAAEEVLDDTPRASALVAIRPSDGHVLALANGTGGRGQPTATLGQYAPGSTFKAVTALAQLRAGNDPGTSLPCPRTTIVDGRTFKNYDDFPDDRLGSMTLTEAIATSCNTALIDAREALPSEALTEAADSLGLTQDPALGVPAAMGEVPTPDSDTSAAAATIGQGTVVATPLAMATMMASITAGQRVTPRLMTTQTPAPSPPGASVTPGEARSMQTMLRAVVTDGSAPFLRDNPGGPIIAKTGTAEYGSADPPRTHAWMVAAQDDLAVAVFVEDGAGGAGTAGPVVDQYLEALQP